MGDLLSQQCDLTWLEFSGLVLCALMLGMLAGLVVSFEVGSE
jgi:hypothetical protein